MVEERYLDEGWAGAFGHVFDAAPFGRDIYYLVSLVLADRRITTLGADFYPIGGLRDEYLRSEVTRILVSIAVALRIEFDFEATRFSKLKKADCGTLYSDWPKRDRVETLTLREACNKIIHATEVRLDLTIPNKTFNPDLEGAYISKPVIYLYGYKNAGKWRGKLQLLNFAKHAALVFSR